MEIRSTKRAKWRKLGYISFQPNDKTDFKAKEHKNVHAPPNTLGTFIKLLINAPHTNHKNIYNQSHAKSLTVEDQGKGKPKDFQP